MGYLRSLVDVVEQVAVVLLEVGRGFDRWAGSPDPERTQSRGAPAGAASPGQRSEPPAPSPLAGEGARIAEAPNRYG